MWDNLYTTIEICAYIAITYWPYYNVVAMVETEDKITLFVQWYITTYGPLTLVINVHLLHLTTNQQTMRKFTCYCNVRRHLPHCTGRIYTYLIYIYIYTLHLGFDLTPAVMLFRPNDSALSFFIFHFPFFIFQPRCLASLLTRLLHRSLFL